MRQVAKKGLMTVAAAGGVLALSGVSAYADSAADGGSANSPGVLSGNTVQAPVHAPVNVCGNTVNVAGALNPAMGNQCVNTDRGGSRSGAHASGTAQNSPGVASGNHVEAPVHAPVNVCGNTVDVGAVLNPSMGNNCANNGTPSDNPSEAPTETPGDTSTPVTERETYRAEPQKDDSSETEVKMQTVAQDGDDAGAQLAETGSSADLGLSLSVGAGLLLGGAVLYRRSRAAQQH